MCSKLTAVWLIWVQYRQRFDAGELEDAQLPSKKTFLPKTISFFDTQREIFESYLQVIRLYLYLYTFIPTRYSAGKFGAFSCFNTWNITYFNGHFQGEPGLVRRWFFMPPPSQTGRRHSVLYLSVCPSVCYQTCEHYILKVNELVLGHRLSVRQRRETIRFCSINSCTFCSTVPNVD